MFTSSSHLLVLCLAGTPPLFLVEAGEYSKQQVEILWRLDHTNEDEHEHYMVEGCTRGKNSCSVHGTCSWNMKGSLS